MRINETAEAMAWYKKWLKKYLERPTIVEREESFVCKVCDSCYATEEAAQNCDHDKIKVMKRCQNCGKLLDLPLNNEMKDELLKEKRFSKYDSRWEVTELTITQAEMDMRGLGSEGEFSFCCLDCLKAWIRQEGWIKERLVTPRCALCRRVALMSVQSVVWNEDEKRFECVSLCVSCMKRKIVELTCPKCGTGERDGKKLDVRIGMVHCLNCGSFFSVFPYGSDRWI